MGNALHVYVFCVMGRLRVMYMWIIGERGFYYREIEIAVRDCGGWNEYCLHGSVILLRAKIRCIAGKCLGCTCACLLSTLLIGVEVSTDHNPSHIPRRSQATANMQLCLAPMRLHNPSNGCRGIKCLIRCEEKMHSRSCVVFEINGKLVFTSNVNSMMRAWEFQRRGVETVG
jgi:hypothetical protein